MSQKTHCWFCCECVRVGECNEVTVEYAFAECKFMQVNAAAVANVGCDECSGLFVICSQVGGLKQRMVRH